MARRLAVLGVGKRYGQPEREAGEPLRGRDRIHGTLTGRPLSRCEYSTRRIGLPGRRYLQGVFMTRRCSRMIVRIPLFLSPLIAFPALAQQELEEIVVTARLRTENYATTPAAIKAFTASEIQAAGIDRVHDFVQLTPNMTVVQTQNPGNTFITIRGISQARNSDMPVAVVVDGVLMTNPAEFNQELNDIQQIEVLKGPQGALYGRNAIGGAINIVTKPATDKFEAKIRAGFD